MRVFAVLLATLLAFDAAAQWDPTRGLSGSTLRLFKAVELNDIGAVKGSLEDGADLNKENADGMTAADLAVDMGHFIIAHYLLSRKLLGEKAPILLTPGKAPAPAATASAPPPKPAFSKPPAKPSPPPAVAAKPEAAPVTAEKPEALPPEMPTEPAQPSPPAVVEAPSPAAAPTEPVTAVAETPPADKPLGDIGVAQFFKSLVEMITPGGEKPAEVAKARPAPAAAPAEPTPPTAATAPETPGGAPAAKAPDEIVVDVTGAKPTGETIQEIKDAPLPSLPAGEIETLTADTPTAKPEADKEKPAATAKDEAAKPAAKPEKREASALDRLADLMKPDEKAPAPAAKAPTEPQAGEKIAAPAAPAAAPAPMTPLPPPPADAQPKAPGKAAATPPPATPGAATAYEESLPQPSPAAKTKFSPRFLDKLADFLESGDEQAFKAWLPEMQIMGANVAGTRPPAAPGGEPGQPAPPTPAAKPAAVAEAVMPPPMPAPPPEMSAMATKTTPPVAPTAPKSPADVPGLSASDAVEADLAGIAGEASPPPVAVAEGAPPPAAPAAPAAEAAPQPGIVKGAINKLLGVLTPTGRDVSRSERLVLEPEEKLAAADGRAPTPAAGPKPWPVTEVEAAKSQPLAPRRPMSDLMLKTSLTGVTLSIGESVSLENSFPPSSNGVDPENQCVKKNRGTTLFCLEPVDWPERLQADFLVPTILYTGHKAIARYDQGIASRLQSLFPSSSFERVIGYFRDRFGPPTDSWNRSIAPFAQPRQDNPTIAWRSVDPKTGAISVLEVRKYDDSRGGFPDTSRGTVMLYLANSPPIFPQVSSHELMRLSRTRMDAPSPDRPPDQPGAAPGAEPGAAPAPEPFALPEPGAPADQAAPEPGAEPAPTGAETPAATGDKAAKQVRDEARAKRRAEREAKRAAGAAKQAAGQAKQEIGAKRAPATKPATGTAPTTPDQSLDLPPDSLLNR